GHSHSTDAGDKRSLLSSGRADADFRRFTGATAGIADVNVVTAGGKVDAGCGAYRDVAAACSVAKKCITASSHVVAAGGVTKERETAISHVEAANGVEL